MVHNGNTGRIFLESLFLILGIAILLSACPTDVPDETDGLEGTDTPYNLGNDDQDGDTSPYSDEYIHWITIDVPNPTTIQSLSMFARRYQFTAATNVCMSVYTDTGGFADTLVVGSEVQTTLTGDLQLLTFDVADTEISAGTYWVGFNADVDISVSADHSLSAKDVCFVGTVATSDAWPVSVSPSRSNDSANNLNVYMTVVD